MTSPIYVPNFILAHEMVMEALRFNLSWVRHDKVPRAEYYWNRFGVPYTYGKGAGARTYQSQPQNGLVELIGNYAGNFLKCEFDVCFLNRYEDSRDHLGWHADDSPEMDDTRPIAIVSLGAAREIWFRPQGSKEPGDVQKLLLESGSLCVMPPGFQDTHFHRIPKADREVGPRISMTYRGYTKEGK